MSLNLLKVTQILKEFYKKLSKTKRVKVCSTTAQAAKDPA